MQSCQLLPLQYPSIAIKSGTRWWMIQQMVMESRGGIREILDIPTTAVRITNSPPLIVCHPATPINIVTAAGTITLRPRIILAVPANITRQHLTTLYRHIRRVMPEINEPLEPLDPIGEWRTGTVVIPR